MLAFNLFVLPPYFSITISDPETVVALFFFLVVALVASNLTASVRAQAILARKRARTTEDLYGFSRKLAGLASMDDIRRMVAPDARKLEGAISGRALYDGRIDPQEALDLIRAARKA